MTDPAGGFFAAGGKSLNYGPTSDHTWMGKWRGGRVADIGTARPQTEMGTGRPVLAKDGTPKMALPITLVCDGSGQNPQTDERTDPSDSGHRTLFVKGTAKYAITEKLRSLGLQAPAVGGELYLRWKGMKATGDYQGRDWDVLYFPPDPSANAGSFFSEPPAQAQQNSAGSGQFRQNDNGWVQPPAPAPVAAPPAFQPPAQAPAVVTQGSADDPWGSAPTAQPPAQQPQDVRAQALGHRPPAGPANDLWA